MPTTDRTPRAAPSKTELPATQAEFRAAARPGSAPLLALDRLYAIAEQRGEVTLSPPVNSAHLMTSAYRFRPGLHRPDGSLLPDSQRSGLSANTERASLGSVRFDAELGGFWLELSGILKDKSAFQTFLFVPKVPAEQLFTLSLSSEQFKLFRAYRDARTQGAVDFDPPIPAASILNAWGKFQESTPWTDGRPLGARLPTEVTGRSPELNRLEPELGGKGIWYKFSFLPEGAAERATRWVLVRKESAEAAPVELVLDDTPKRVLVAFQRAKQGLETEFNPPLKGETLFNATGTLKKGLVFPDYSRLGEIRGSGLPQPSSNILVRGVRYRPEDATYILQASALDRAEEQHVVEIEFCRSGPGNERGWSVQSVSADDKKLLNWYSQARKQGVVLPGYSGGDEETQFPFALPGSSALSARMLLPDGTRLSKALYIGFAKGTSDIRFAGMEHRAELPGFRLTLEGLGPNRAPRRISLDIYEQKTAAERVRKIDIDLPDLRLPEAFRRTPPRLFSALQARLDSKKLGTELTPASGRRLSFVKGEAFEQLAGILLASIYPNDYVTPQFCLRVDPERGTFGTRVDFRIGTRLFEIKWGRFAENIRETLEKHRPLVPGGHSYELIAAERDEGLPPGTKLFSDLLLESTLAPELARAFTRLNSFSTAEDAGSLTAMRDYLYGELKASRSLDGEARVDRLRKSLQTFLSSAAAELPRYHYPPLEAFFEYQGKVYRSYIAPRALFEEQPEEYAPRYTFGDLSFSSRFDRDIAVLLELGSREGRYSRAEQLISLHPDREDRPVFDLGGEPPLRISSHATPNVQRVTSLSDLKQYLHFDSDYYEFGLAWVSFFGDEA